MWTRYCYIIKPNLNFLRVNLRFCSNEKISKLLSINRFYTYKKICSDNFQVQSFIANLLETGKIWFKTKSKFKKYSLNY